jgi:ankyrin repeat protein
VQDSGIKLTRFKRSIEEPAQVKLEQAISRGPSSKIDDVLDALKDGANPDAGIFDNRLPYLVIAASRSDVPAIKALLDAGADPNMRATIDYEDIKNPLPLDVVTFSEYSGVAESVELLLAAGADPSQSIMKLGACRRGDLSLYNRIQNSDTSILFDAKDQNCLHHAAETNQVAFLNALLFDLAYKGEKIKEMLVMSNHIGRTPLDVAIAKKHFEAALLIAKAGGKANREGSIKDVMRNQVEDPVLEELKELILRDKIQ